MGHKLERAPSAPAGRLREAFSAHLGVLEAAAYAAAGFLAASAAVMGTLAPFGVALSAAAARRKRAGAALLGAAAGYLFTFILAGGLRYLLAMGILTAMQWLISGGAPRGRLFRPLVCAGALGVSSLVVSFAAGGSVYDLVLAFSEMLLCGCACFFFDRTIDAVERRLENLSQSDLVSLLLTFCILIVAMMPIKPFGVSLGRVAAAFIILLGAQAAREAGGAVAGVAAGLAAGAFGAGQTFLLGAYGFGGLLAGVFAPLGRLASTGVFLLVNLFALFAAHRMDAWSYLLEILIAGGALLFVRPETIQKQLSRAVMGSQIQDESCKALIGGRINQLSGALRDVAATTRKVNDRLSGLSDGDPASVCSCAADRICRGCRKKSECWQLKYYDTNDAFNHALTALKQNGRIGETDFPAYFANACPQLPALCDAMERLFSEFSGREIMKRKAAQVRGVVTDQFEGMALMIDAMGGELDRLAAQDNTSAGKIRGYLRSRAVFPEKILCMVDTDANMTVEIVLPAYKLARLDLSELALACSELCGREFDLPARRELEDGRLVQLTLTEKAAFTVKWGATQLGHSQSKLCGDSYSYVNSRNGRVNIILSDGMGSGGAAAVDSAMTSELLARLIEAGVSMDAALRLVNSVMVVKSGEESLATIDLTGIDLYTGQVEFYKAGAAPTFLRKSGKTGYVEARSLPIGILSGVGFEKNAVTLRAGDWVIMVTDGAVSGGYGWLLSDLGHYEGEDPKELSAMLAGEARRRRDDGHEDDITVIAILLEKGI